MLHNLCFEWPVRASIYGGKSTARAPNTFGGMSGRRGKLKRQREGVSEFVSITGAEESFAEKFLEVRCELGPLLAEWTAF